MDLALFDFDGTITTHETFPGFMHAAVPPRRLAVGKVLFAPLILGYRLGLVSGKCVRAAIVMFGLRGLALDEYRARGEAFAQQVLPGTLRAEALQRIEWHRSRGDRVVVVSGTGCLPGALVPRARSRAVVLSARAPRRPSDRSLSRCATRGRGKAATGPRTPRAL